MRTLKVWGGGLHLRQLPDGTKVPFNRVPRGLVCAETKKRAIELLGQVTRITRGEFDEYWGQTGNKDELSLAKEEGVWVNCTHHWQPKKSDYTRLI